MKKLLFLGLLSVSCNYAATSSQINAVSKVEVGLKNQQNSDINKSQKLICILDFYKAISDSNNTLEQTKASCKNCLNRMKILIHKNQDKIALDDFINKQVNAMQLIYAILVGGDAKGDVASEWLRLGLYIRNYMTIDPTLCLSSSISIHQLQTIKDKINQNLSSASFFKDEQKVECGTGQDLPEIIMVPQKQISVVRNYLVNNTDILGINIFNKLMKSNDQKFAEKMMAIIKNEVSNVCKNQNIVNKDYFIRKLDASNEHEEKVDIVLRWSLQLLISNPLLGMKDIQQIVKNALGAKNNNFEEAIKSAMSSLKTIKYACNKSLYQIENNTAKQQMPIERIQIYITTQGGMFPGVENKLPIDNQGVCQAFGVLEELDENRSTTNIEPSELTQPSAAASLEIENYTKKSEFTGTLDAIISRINDKFDTPGTKIDITDKIKNLQKSVSKFIDSIPEGKEIFFNKIIEHVKTLVLKKITVPGRTSKNDQKIIDEILECFYPISPKPQEITKAKKFTELTWQERADRCGKNIIVLLRSKNGVVSEEEVVKPKLSIDKHNIILIRNEGSNQYSIVTPIYLW